MRQIHQAVLAHSQYIRAANYTVIHPEDLELLFAAYDKVFFCRALRPRPGRTQLALPALAAHDQGRRHDGALRHRGGRDVL